MKVLVTGAGGRLGRELAQIARDRGHAVRGTGRGPTAPGSGVAWVRADLSTGEGLDDAVSGVDTVIHAASDPRRSDAVDVQGTRRLIDAARREGVEHLVYISIIGIDSIGLAYYRAKLAAERMIREGGVPYTILRTAQFHDFLDLLLSQAARFPVLLPVPWGFWIQSISTVEVAEALCTLAGGAPSGAVPDLAGPERMELSEAARLWLRVRGLRRPVVRFPVPGSVGAALRAGYNTTPGRAGGRETWSEWLRARYGSAATGG